MNRWSRVLAVLVAVVAISAMVAVGYRYQVAHKPKPPLVGVVHETEIRIAPEISARLKSLVVTSAVRKGETLAELSSPEIAASLEEAKANAESARANLANVAAGVRQEEIDEAVQRAAVAASNLALAKQQFQRVSTLVAKNFASRQQYDEDAAALAEADAHLNLSQAALAESKAGPTREQLAIAGS